MKTKRIVLTFGLCLALVLIIIWILSPTFSQAWAHSDMALTPRLRIGGSEATRSRANIPLKEHITDSQDQTQPEITPLTSTSADIANGDFEGGQDGSWQEYSNYGRDVITNTSTLPVTPHSGSWAAWLGGDFDHLSYISQGVTIPDGASTLSFWNWIDSEDTCGFDNGWVSINNNDVLAVDLCAVNNTSSWVERTIDISVYAGQVITLQIGVSTNDSLNSNYFVDDFTLETTSYTYLPIIFKNYWVGYFDDFNDPDGGWPVGEDDWWKYGYLNGEYQFYLKTKQGVFWMTPGPITGRDLYLPSDYRVEAQARKVSGGRVVYGLTFGLHYTSNALEGYELFLNPASGEFHLEKYMMDGSSSVVIDWTFSSAINQGGGTNHIAVERVGSNIKLYINSIQVANITDSSFLGPGRDAGLIARIYDGPPVDIRFDNFAASQK